MFYCSDNSLTLLYSSQYGESSLSKKLNGHEAFESMSLLGALFSLKQSQIKEIKYA